MRLLILSTVPSTLTAFLLPFATHFRQFGWRVDAGASNIGSENTLEESFDTLHEIPWSRRLFTLTNFTQATGALHRLVAQNRYDLVHVHTPIAAFLTRFALRRLRPNVKIIYTAHGFHFGYANVSPFRSPYFYVEKIAARWTDALIVINQDDFQIAKCYHLIPPDRLHHTPGIGIDLEEYDRNKIQSGEIASKRAELGLRGGDFLLLMIAEFNPGKRHRDLLAAFEILDRSDVHLAFAGTGPQFEEIKKVASKLKLARNIHF